jgi:serine/threonine-protein kinase
MQHGLPQPNDVIADKYTVLQALGRGGMGAVYIVAHRLTGKRLALKCLLPEYADNADLVERFVREAQAMGRIEHRHVVDVFDVGRDRNVLYIVMELLDGKPLSDLLHDEQLTLEETLAILVRAMEGVAAAHVHGIVHRDLKPDNIFVCWGASGRLDDPRVLDFGISKLEDGTGTSLTRSGVAMGTPCYMSLEQLSGQRDLDQRVDVYAMGVILYEAIAGVPPHMADSVAALAIRVLTTVPTHLAELRPDLPPGLADVVMKAIARDREHRYPTMNALMDAVRPYVPRGAGLLVPEGQGRPLRTPRNASAASRPGSASAATATPQPLPFPAPRVANPTPAPAAAQPAAAPQLASAAPAGPRERGSSPLRWTLLVLLVLLVAAGGAWGALRLRPDLIEAVKAVPSTPPAAEPAPAAPTAPLPSASTPHTPPAAAPAAGEATAPAAVGEAPPAPGEATAPAAATGEAPPAAGEAPAPPAVSTVPPAAHAHAAPAQQVTADAAAPGVAQPHEPPARAERGARHKREHQAAPRPPVATPTPAAQGPNTAQGRAGKLRSDDF